MKNISITLMVISIVLFVVSASNAYINYQQNKKIAAVVDLVQTNYELSELQYLLNKKRIDNVSTQITMTYEAMDYEVSKGVKFD